MPFTAGHDIGAAHRWRKGESGNPRGRSKHDFSLAEAARVHSAEALAIILEIARDEDAPHEARLKAADMVLDRGHGRPIAANLLQGEIQHHDATAIFAEAMRECNEQLRTVDNAPPLLPTQQPPPFGGGSFPRQTDTGASGAVAR